MTPEEISEQYWAGSIVDDRIVWAHANVITFFADHGLKMKNVLPHVGTCFITKHCYSCSIEVKLSAGCRTELARLQKLSTWAIRCPECKKKAQAAEAAAMKAATEKEAAEKLAALEVYRKSLILKHGVLMTGELCPECQDGFLIVRLNSTAMKPFLSCSRFNPHRWSCDYTQPLAPEFHEQFMPIFRERLLQKAATAATA